MNPQDSAWELDELGDVQPLETVSVGIRGYFLVTASSLAPEPETYCDEYWIFDEDENIEPKVSFTPE